MFKRTVDPDSVTLYHKKILTPSGSENSSWMTIEAGMKKMGAKSKYINEFFNQPYVIYTYVSYT